MTTRRTTRFMTLFIAMLFPLMASAQTSLKIAAKSSTGTYHDMLGQVKSVCQPSDFTIDEDMTVQGGAKENLQALRDNQVVAAFMHSDVILYAAQTDGTLKLNFKTLVALYPEEVHVLALRNSKATKATYGGLYHTPVNLTSLQDLAGFDIGAAGGGTITARALSAQGGHFGNIVEFGSGDEVIKALQSGQIHAGIFVGGSPLRVIQNLKAEDFKLLPIGDSLTASVGGWYKPVTINYPNLKAENIRTVAPWALLVTQVYKQPKMVDLLAKFRACFYNNLDDLQATPGMHPKWRQVNPQDHGVWEWYDLPTTTHPPAYDLPKKR